MNHTTDARHHSHPAVAFTAELVAKASLTPHDAGCQALLIEKLTALGFTCEILVFDDVTNLWAKKEHRHLCSYSRVTPTLYQAEIRANGVSIHLRPPFTTNNSMVVAVPI